MEFTGPVGLAASRTGARLVMLIAGVHPASNTWCALHSWPPGFPHSPRHSNLFVLLWPNMWHTEQLELWTLLCAPPLCGLSWRPSS